jgi:DsbC/DsbD-like thiol-disulfide interchange protein
LLFARLIVCACLAVFAAPQQSAAPAPPPLSSAGRASIDTPHLTIATSLKNVAAAADNRVSLTIDVSPKPKMHVYAPGQKDYIPVAVTLQSNPAYRALAPVFPKPMKYFFAPLKETQLVYSKPFRIVQDVVLERAAAGATVTIAGTLRYQACDDAICYLPKNVPLSWTVPVKASR